MMTTKTKTSQRKSGRVPVVSDAESPARQRRNEARRKEFASEHSAQGKWENETFVDYSVDDLVAFLKSEDIYIHDDEGRARRLIGNILSVGVDVVRTRLSAQDGIERIQSFLQWDDRTQAVALKRYNRAKKAYRAKTGKKWKNK